jgi:hypothetical protein
MNSLGYYSQTELLKLDLNGIEKLEINRYFIGYLGIQKFDIRVDENVRHLPPLFEVSRLFIINTKIRKIDYSKLTHFTARDIRIKSIKKGIEFFMKSNTKIKDCSYVGDISGNKYLKFIFFF